jgi:Domain of unknown function (DUF6434)
MRGSFAAFLPFCSRSSPSSYGGGRRSLRRTMSDYEWPLEPLGALKRKNDPTRLRQWRRGASDTEDFDCHRNRITRGASDHTDLLNTQNVRPFFKAYCGSSFKFDRSFMAWLKDGRRKTIGEAADEWRCGAARGSRGSSRGEVSTEVQGEYDEIFSFLERESVVVRWSQHRSGAP